jgi:hypothetical protein
VSALVSVGGWLEGFDGHCRAVGGYLGHDVADLVAVEAHGDDGVSAERAGLSPQRRPWALLSAVTACPM